MIKKGHGLLGSKEEKAERAKEDGTKHICLPRPRPGFQDVHSLISIFPLNAMGNLIECV